MKFERVMLVDDSEPDQFLAKLVLSRYRPGIEVMQAYDGKEALDLLASDAKQPDVIFLDINMPRMDGHEFLKEFDKTGHDATIVVMLTSSDQARDKAETEHYDYVLEHISKPLREEHLEALNRIKV